MASRGPAGQIGCFPRSRPTHPRLKPDYGEFPPLRSAQWYVCQAARIKPRIGLLHCTQRLISTCPSFVQMEILRSSSLQEVSNFCLPFTLLNISTSYSNKWQTLIVMPALLNSLCTYASVIQSIYAKND
jgi:hypothetical protein